MNKLNGKIIFTSTLELVTGLHIGGGNDFAAIGAVDSVVIRNPVTMEPYIPGSSIKGKMRYLLARTLSNSPKLTKVSDEPLEIQRLFGGNSKENVYISRLQFYDVFFNIESKNKLENLDTDLFLSEIKYENTINRLTAEATPRQNERVVPSSLFDFKLVYNIEDEKELNNDINNIGLVFSLLEDDYLGGNGTRGYGRVAFNDINIEIKKYNDDFNIDIKEIKDMFNNGRNKV